MNTLGTFLTASTTIFATVTVFIMLLSHLETTLPARDNHPDDAGLTESHTEAIAGEAATDQLTQNESDRARPPVRNSPTVLR